MSALDFNNHFLNQIIYHSIKDDDFIKLIRNAIDYDIFKTKEKKFLAEIIFQYYDEYKCAPKDNFYDLFKEREKSMEQDLYERCINVIGVLKDITGSNPEYILNTLQDAIKHFRMEEASIEFASLIKLGRYDEAKQVILNSMREPELVRECYDYFSDCSFIEDRLSEKKYKMVSGIYHFDKLIGGYNPSWLITFLGGKNFGKSWQLMDTAVQAVLQGLNVVFISLEMNKAQVDERFDMIFGFMNDKRIKQCDLMTKINERWLKCQNDVDNIYQIDKVIKNRRLMKRMYGGGLKIFAFNRGRMSWRDVESHLNLLEERDGFIADVLIVDYLGLMKETSNRQTTKERISDNCMGLKELAGTKNLIVFTAMQGNRQALQSKIIKSYMISEDINVIFNSDLIPAICQTPIEELKNQHRIYIANFRHGLQHRSVGIIRDLSIGQMNLDSFELKQDQEQEQEEKVIGVDF